MSKLITVRLDDELLRSVDRERKQAGLTRARVIQTGVALWLERRRTEEAIRRDQEGYTKQPIDPDEFAGVLGAQVGPK
jgi:hypothetical protein